MAEKKLKKLPLGISDFRKIIEGNYIYVNKTKLVYQLITSGEYYFLSRPRRFGKSLLVSTLAELFAGNKELFKNMWIGQSDYDWQKYPIIRFDFSTISTFSAEELRHDIIDTLEEIASSYHVDISKQRTITSKFKMLIKLLGSDKKLVILVDEYDRPILDHIDNPHEAEMQREILKSLYIAIKGSDSYIRFVLLTGVSKFAKTSIFSGINNLRDISMSDEFTTLLGYTEKEFLDVFSGHLLDLIPGVALTMDEAVGRVRDQYDGYRFCRSIMHVFNPYSVLTCLTEKVLGSYWFASGTPAFLIKLLQKNDYDLQSVTRPVLNAEDLGSFELDNIPLSSLLFQTGYLTIKQFDPKTNNYTLGIPNIEVDSGFTRQLVNMFTLLPPDKSIVYARVIAHAFMHRDMHELEQKLQEFFNKMPYTVHIKSESQLQFVLYAIFALIGVTVDPEVTTSLGRADLVVSFPKLVYVIELKFNKTAQQALNQIQDKKYYEKFLNSSKHITLVGINFDEPTKTVSLESSAL